MYIPASIYRLIELNVIYILRQEFAIRVHKYATKDRGVAEETDMFMRRPLYIGLLRSIYYYFIYLMGNVIYCYIYCCAFRKSHSVLQILVATL